jgi:quercetin dioxygenase-like cupin family protein
MPQPTPAQHTRWSDIPAELMNPLLTRQFVTGSEAMLARIELKKGCLVPQHAHHNEQIAFIASGSMKFTLIENEQPRDYILHTGDVLVIPPHVPHSAEALEDTIDFDIFSPPRHDWISGDDSYLR